MGAATSSPTKGSGVQGSRAELCGGLGATPRQDGADPKPGRKELQASNLPTRGDRLPNADLDGQGGVLAPFYSFFMFLMSKPHC